MKRGLAGLALVLVTMALSGCYYEPGYSYVRGNGYQGGAYYGEGPAVIYEPSYDVWYGPGWGYGCCYAPGVSIGVSGVWYQESRHQRGRDQSWNRTPPPASVDRTQERRQERRQERNARERERYHERD